MFQGSFKSIFLREETFLDSTEKSPNIIFKEKIFLDLTDTGKLILIIFKKIVSKKKNHSKILKFVLCLWHQNTADLTS